MHIYPSYFLCYLASAIFIKVRFVVDDFQLVTSHNIIARWAGVHTDKIWPEIFIMDPNDWSVAYINHCIIPGAPTGNLS